MRPQSTWRPVGVLAAAVAAASFSADAARQEGAPSISVKVSPSNGVSPLDIVVTAELKGGSNDFEDFYCATVVWEWGDGTKSESTPACEPYEAGKSAITRRYEQRHTFRWNDLTHSPVASSGRRDLLGAQLPQGASNVGSQQTAVHRRITFTLKQRGKTVGSGRATVDIKRATP